MSGLGRVRTNLANPAPMGISLSDHLTGMMAAYGILGALMARERTGRGQRVETSLLSATVAFLGENAARYFETGKTPSRETRARSLQTPGRPKRSLDGHRRLLEAIERHDPEGAERAVRRRLEEIEGLVMKGL
mgnify:CR=1 FL=1